MDEENITEVDWLRDLYIEDLSKIVDYYQNPRPRVRHPGKWSRLPSQISLAEDISEPLLIPTIDKTRKVWIWSDQHFSHKNIIAFSQRPYEDVEQMNEYMIANYNDYVGENDICIWVGDVGFKGTTHINELLEQCNGYKILVVGNHDFNGKKLRNLNFDETHLIYTIDYPDISLVFTHYPMFNVPWPWVNVHGHMHIYPNPDTGHPLHINVNCEVQAYRPILLDEVVTKARMRMISAKM